MTSRISLIFDPPFPIKDPHWEAGTTSLNETADEDCEGVDEAEDDFPLNSPIEDENKRT